MSKNNSVSEGPVEDKFSKQALAESKRYRDRKDLVNALLSDGEEYTYAEADEIIKIFMEREVK